MSKRAISRATECWRYTESSRTDHRHASGGAVTKAPAPRASSLERQQSARVHREYEAAKLMVPCHEIAEAMRQARHPLAYRHMWQDAVHEARSALDHAPAAAARAEATALTGKEHQLLEGGSLQRRRAKPCARTPHVRKSRNSCSTNFGKRWPSACCAATSRNVSRCSSTTRYNTPCSAARG